jgi:hypothetical protein
MSFMTQSTFNGAIGDADSTVLTLAHAAITRTFALALLATSILYFSLTTIECYSYY